MGRATNQRRASREGVAIAANCRTATGRHGDVVIVDLSAMGCRIFAKSLPLSAGLRLRIRPENFESLAGAVCWVSQGFAGIEFEKPLYGPVAEHLQRSFGR
jgi:hypothetical protein